MGQQVIFYMTPGDTSAALGRLRRCGPLVILHSKSPERKPKVVPDLNVTEQGKRWLYFYLTRPTDMSSISMREVPTQRYWAIDEIDSPVIELNLSFYNGQGIRRGRAY